MVQEVVSEQTKPKGLPISAVFSLEGLVNAEHRSALVSRVLNEFSNLSRETQNALRSVVNDEIIPTTGGFRRGQAGRALGNSSFLLLEPVQKALLLSNDLSLAVLRCWVESHPSLREAVERHLADRSLDSSGPDLAGKLFLETWLPEEWRAEQAAFATVYEGYDQNDVALMICYLSGKIPLEHDPDAKREGGGAVISAALSYLRELPSTAPEWDREIPDFAASISGLIEDKAKQRRWSADFDATVENIRGSFSELLEFFEHDTKQWAAARVSPEAGTVETLRLAERLRSLLADYLPVHERATGISQERERTRKREELQPAILDTLNEIDSLITASAGNAGNDSREDGKADSPTIPRGPLHSEGIKGVRGQSPPPVVNRTAPELEPPLANPLQEALPAAEPAVQSRAVAVAAPPGPVSVEYTALRSENLGLRNNTDALRSENQDLRDEVEALKTELFGSQEREESWRMAYRSAMDGSLEENEEPPPNLDNVNAAVEMAKNSFRQELLFVPNSESNVENNPFTDPRKVWEALRWLATTYYPSKMGRLRVTDFDQSIKEACGWWYKGDQGETTLSRYEKSYTTRVDGRRHWLAEHIGKGTTFDARYTIRIAFAWDRERRQVIVGYIGRHQQTDAS